MTDRLLSIPAGVSACSEAATAKEAAFRMDYPLAAARNTRVVAFDVEAARVVREASGLEWSQATFYYATDPGLVLTSLTTGGEVPLAEILADSNTVMLVSTSGENVEAIDAIGAACRVRGIMTAGLVLTPAALASEALVRLRPHARILLVPAEAEDLVELLRATRA
jgi:hypothetical protein